MKWILKSFEDLNKEELYKILRLRNEVFIVEQECPYQDLDNKDFEAFHLFLENNGEIICSLRILRKGVSYEEVSIGRVIVNIKYRGKGIAREALLKAISFIQEFLNENKIRISAQAHLVNFYESVGFKVVSDIYLEDNIPHVQMIYSKID